MQQPIFRILVSGLVFTVVSCVLPASDVEKRPPLEFSWVSLSATDDGGTLVLVARIENTSNSHWGGCLLITRIGGLGGTPKTWDHDSLKEYARTRRGGGTRVIFIDTPPSAPFECREVSLGPGEGYQDTTMFDANELGIPPRTLSATFYLWTGSRGGTFGEATVLASKRVERFLQ